ncbi:MAG: hypothetical protein KC591_04030 [Gemmatimonadetes bacterium]|nr:hypothetical protein [Gemmatimonadota bacterium]
MHPGAPILVVAAVLFASAARGDEPDWRPLGRAAFREAKDAGRPVVLWLTAPWNRDHFLWPRHLFADSTLSATIARRAIPVRADASRWPELRDVWALDSGLLPAVHFLDEHGRVFASFPPPEAEELVYWLEDYADPADRPPPIERRPVPALDAGVAPLDDVIARELLERLLAGTSPLGAVHADVDLAPLMFLNEWGAWRGDPRLADVLDTTLDTLLGSALFDRVDGGFHRAFATADGRVVHREKLLRANAVAGEALASRFATSGRLDFGADALLIVRCLNGRFRTRAATLYCGSLAADLYASSDGSLVMTGEEWYARGAEARQVVGAPTRSTDVPVGANWRLLESFAHYFRAFGDERFSQAVRTADAALRPGSFDATGAACRELDSGQVGNLRDQGDVGSGLLALHALTGDPSALDSAREIARAIRDRFRRDDGSLRDLAVDADLPDEVRSAPDRPGFQGAALRFLTDLFVVTAEAEWHDLAAAGLEAWRHRLPADDVGLGELGRAAFRSSVPPPLVVCDAVPGTEEGDRLGALAQRIADPTMCVRWIASEDRATRTRFGFVEGEAPALRIVWGDTSPALRTAVTFRRAYERARERLLR